jgi:hypothetical protein
MAFGEMTRGAIGLVTVNIVGCCVQVDTGLDWSAVVAVARENAKAAGMADRYETIAGSAFEADWGKGYDVVLLPNFLHHFDEAECTDLLHRAHAALKPGGGRRVGPQRGSRHSADAGTLCHDHAVHHGSRGHLHSIGAGGDPQERKIRAAQDHPARPDANDASVVAGGMNRSRPRPATETGRRLKLAHLIAAPLRADSFA